jgi:membrane carboxypeptidase/penicillin-binding protein
MGAALKDQPNRQFRVPQGITRARIDLDTGLIATENCPRTIEAAFLTGSEPQQVCYEHREQDYWWNWDNWLGGNEDTTEKNKKPPRIQKMLDWWKNL